MKIYISIKDEPYLNYRNTIYSLTIEVKDKTHSKSLVRVRYFGDRSQKLFGFIIKKIIELGIEHEED